MWASTVCPLGSSTWKVALGSASFTTPCTSITSCFDIEKTSVGHFAAASAKGRRALRSFLLVSKASSGSAVPVGARWKSFFLSLIHIYTLEVEVRNTRMVSGQRMLFQFAGDKLTVSGDITLPDNGGLAGKCLEPVTFTLREGEVSTKTKMYWEQ